MAVSSLTCRAFNLLTLLVIGANKLNKGAFESVSPNCKIDPTCHNRARGKAVGILYGFSSSLYISTHNVL